MFLCDGTVPYHATRFGLGGPECTEAAILLNLNPKTLNPNNQTNDATHQQTLNMAGKLPYLSRTQSGNLVQTASAVDMLSRMNRMPSSRPAVPENILN